MKACLKNTLALLCAAALAAGPGLFPAAAVGLYEEEPAPAQAAQEEAVPVTQTAQEEQVSVTEAALEAEILAAAAITPDENLPVRSAILIDQASGDVFFALNEHEALPPASVTKIMSLLLFMEAIDAGTMKLDDIVVCSDTAAAYGGSQIWLKPGEEMSVNDLLKAIAISSANDATVCLAEHVAGSETAFVQLMNERAAQLGMNDTVFKCAAGLDNEGHLSSAYDIALMSRALLSHPLILDYSTVWMDSLRGGATELVNTNRLVRFYEGATGLKTGTTSGAGSCLSASATRDGLSLIAVVMGAPTSDDRFSAARALLDWGFANYMTAPLTPPDTILPLTVTGGVQPQVELYCEPPAGITIERAKKDSLTQDVVMDPSVAAPVAKGQQVGNVVVCVGGEQKLQYPICAAQDIEEMTLWRAFGILGRSLLATC